MTFLSRRIWLLGGAAAMFASGALGVACSNNGGFNDGGGPDANPDNTTGPDSGGDSGGGDSGNNDGGTTVTCEAGVTGACDIVAQNCGSGKDCAVVQTDGGYTTQCVTNTTGTIKEGYACSSGGSNNPCVAGLECIQGRCSKHCCAGDDSVCGTSHPENNPGRCDLSVTVNGTDPAYNVCTYSSSCQLFDIQPCTTGQTCIVQDSNGTASCTGFSGADAGEGKPCVYANDCAKDGMICVGNLDGGTGNLCYWECYHPPGPYDAGIANQGAGMGGCPNAETCNGINWGTSAPAWLGLCK